MVYTCLYHPFMVILVDGSYCSTNITENYFRWLIIIPLVQWQFLGKPFMQTTTLQKSLCFRPAWCSTDVHLQVMSC